MDRSDPVSTLLHDSAPLSRFQLLAIATLMGVNALDGFDAFAINFASPGIASEWGVEKDALGYVKSMSLIGMSIGSLVIAPIADRVGRRPVILAATLLLGLSMLACAFVSSVAMLSFWRVITGVGIGTMLASVTALASELGNAKNRALCVSVATIGYPLGATLGGFMAAELLERFDWRSIFIFGGAVSTLYVPVVAWRLPESLAFLANRRAPGDLERINISLARMGHGALAAFPDAAPIAKSRDFLRPFRGAMLPITLCVIAAYFFHMMTFYYFVSWVPDIVFDLGYSQADAARALTWANLAGAGGGLAIGWAASRIGVTWPSVVAALAGAGALIVFGQSGDGLLALTVKAAIAGFFLNALVIILYAIMARAFPAHMRVQGTGLVLGLGRGGGIAGPIAAGYLFTAGFGTAPVSMIMAGGAVISAVFIIALAVLARRRSLLPQESRKLPPS